jgi:hypothetical protein
MRRIAIVGFVLLLVTGSTAPAQADELSDFEMARRLYERGAYRKAAGELEGLVGGEVPRAQNPVVRLEARKYLGATYLFLDREADARQQFRRLLEEDANYEIDRVAFPSVVVRSFQEVQAQVRRENAAVRAREAERERAERESEMQEILSEQERIRTLEELAATETVEQVNSRWIAAIPFGAGQFQNGHRRFGITLAVVESGLLLGSIATFIAHNSLRDEDPAPDEIDRAQRVERALRISNWVSSGLFVGTAVAGIIDAEVRFKPVIRSTRSRELPPELEPPPTGGLSMELGLGLMGGSIGLRF